MRNLRVNRQSKGFALRECSGGGCAIVLLSRNTRSNRVRHGLRQPAQRLTTTAIKWATEDEQVFPDLFTIVRQGIGTYVPCSAIVHLEGITWAANKT